LFHCWRHNFGSKKINFTIANATSLQTTQFWQRITNSLQNTQFSSKCYFAADNSISAANHKFVVELAIRHRMLLRCSQLSFGNESQFRCRTHISAANVICCRTHISTANHNSAADISTSTANHKFAAEHAMWQRMLIRCRYLSFGSESQFRCKRLNSDSESQIRCRTYISAANANPLQTTQFRQQITIRCRTPHSAEKTNSPQKTQFRQRIANSLPNTNFGMNAHHTCCNNPST